MRKMVFAGVFVIMSFAAMSICYADRGDWRGGIRDRIYEDQQRIERGLHRGSLTEYEAEKLNRELARILHRMDRMKEDGHLDRHERNRINRELDRLDGEIVREKRDRERRW